jgi:sugar phosphate isomerase/epimerase
MPIKSMPLGVTAVMLPELDFAEQLALCSKLGVTHYSLRPRVIPDAQRDKPFANWGNHKFDLTPRRLLSEARQIRKQMSDAGITPFGTVPGLGVESSVDEIKLNLEGAAAVGAGRVRIGPLPVPSEAFDYRSLLLRTIDGYRKVVALAKPLGIKVVIETHAWSLATSPGLALLICQSFDAADVGVIFDLPNFALEGGVQPRLAVAVLRPYIDHLHIGGAQRVGAGVDQYGFRKTANRMGALDESDLNIPDWITALDHAGVRVPLIIEDYTEGLPGAQRLENTSRKLAKLLEAM